MKNIIKRIKILINIFYFSFTFVFGFFFLPLIGVRTDDIFLKIYVGTTIASIFFTFVGYFLIYFTENILNKIAVKMSIKIEKLEAMIKLSWLYVHFYSPFGLSFLAIFIIIGWLDPVTRATNLDMEMRQVKPWSLKGLKMYIKELKEIIDTK